MIALLEEKLMSFAEVLPLEIFIFVGSLFEEVVVPIPSPAVVLLSGSIAELQGRGVLALVPLAIIGALGKTLGAFIIYEVADKAEDLLVGSFGKFFDISKGDIERLGSKLGKGWRDYVMLTFLRAIPVMPSVVLSLGGGMLRIPLRLFLFSAFCGSIIRDSFYLYAGYAGVAAFFSLIDHSTKIETVIEVAAVVLVLAFIVYKYRKRSRRAVSR